MNVGDIIITVLSYVFACLLSSCAGWGFGYGKCKEEERMSTIHHASELARQYVIGFEQGRKCAVDKMVDMDMISHKQAQKLLRKWDDTNASQNS